MYVQSSFMDPISSFQSLTSMIYIRIYIHTTHLSMVLLIL